MLNSNETELNVDAGGYERFNEGNDGVVGVLISVVSIVLCNTCTKCENDVNVVGLYFVSYIRYGERNGGAELTIAILGVESSGKVGVDSIGACFFDLSINFNL